MGVACVVFWTPVVLVCFYLQIIVWVVPIIKLGTFWEKRGAWWSHTQSRQLLGSPGWCSPLSSSQNAHWDVHIIPCVQCAVNHLVCFCPVRVYVFDFVSDHLDYHTIQPQIWSGVVDCDSACQSAALCTVCLVHFGNLVWRDNLY